MPVRVDVRGSAKAVVADLDAQGLRAVTPAIVSALNQTMSQVNTRSRREIAARAGIAQKHVRPRLKQLRASFRKQSATLIALTAGIPLIRLPRSRAKNIPGAFVQTMPGGYEGVFKRRGRPRLPIDEQRLEIRQDAEAVIRQIIGTFAPRKFTEILSRELQRRLRR